MTMLLALLVAAALGGAAPPHGPAPRCPASCDDGNACTVDSCDVHGTCHNIDVARCAVPHAATVPLPSGSSCAPIACPIPDRDGDGLNDAWEAQGGIDLDCNGVLNPGHDLILQDADPDRPDVYLQYDSMELPDQGAACATTADCERFQRCVAGTCRGHSHAPRRASLRALEDAFARRGVALHARSGDALAHRSVVTYDPVTPSCSGNDAVNFYDLKSAHFDPRRRLAYHYVVFGHYNTCDEVSHCSLCPQNGGGPVVFGAGGKAELPGNDAMVTLGVLLDLGIDPFLEHEAGVLMHELGHNFGLRHGGDDDRPEFKPNYLSAVNNNFTYTGIPVGAGPGDRVPMPCARTADCPTGALCSPQSHVCLRIDYSPEALATLDETHLDENVGLSAGTDDITTYDCPDQSPRRGAATGPIDWNCNGDPTDPDVAVDLNADGEPARTLLTGHADWPSLRMEFQCTANGSANLTAGDGFSGHELSVVDAVRTRRLFHEPR